MAKVKPIKKKLISFRAPEELHRSLRMRAATEGVTIEHVAAAALTQYLTASRGRAEVA